LQSVLRKGKRDGTEIQSPQVPPNKIKRIKVEGKRLTINVTFDGKNAEALRLGQNSRETGGIFFWAVPSLVERTAIRESYIS